MKKTKKKTATVAKRKGKNKAKAKRFAAPIPVLRNPRETPAPLSDLVHRGPVPDTTPRPLAVPELWCKIEQPVVVRFMEAMRADDAASLGEGRKRPAMLARVYDMDDRETKDLALPERLAAVFAGLPFDGYIGHVYCIHRHRRHERKNAAGYTVQEVMETTAS